MQNEKLIEELIKSNLCINAIKAGLSNRPLQYSLHDGITDGLRICNALCKQHEEEKQENDVASARLQIILKLFEKYTLLIKDGPSTLTFESGFVICEYCAGKLNTAHTKLDLDTIVSSVKEEIRMVNTFTEIDRYNLSMFVDCLSELYEYDLKCGVCNG